MLNTLRKKNKVNQIKNNIKKKPFEGKQRSRLENILKLLKPIFKKIKQQDICNVKNAHKILNLSVELSQLHINLSKIYEFNPILKRFRTQQEWYLLHLVNIYSAKGETCYKEKLAQHPLLANLCSYKTLYKSIDALVAEGLFIVMPGYMANGKKTLHKNIRPSELLVTAYLTANIENLLDNLKFIKKNTKLTIGDA